MFPFHDLGLVLQIGGFILFLFVSVPIISHGKLLLNDPNDNSRSMRFHDWINNHHSRALGISLILLGLLLQSEILFGK